jgi:hypothetical protein
MGVGRLHEGERVGVEGASGLPSAVWWAKVTSADVRNIIMSTDAPMRLRFNKPPYLPSKSRTRPSADLFQTKQSRSHFPCPRDSLRRKDQALPVHETDAHSPPVFVALQHQGGVQFSWRVCSAHPTPRGLPNLLLLSPKHGGTVR